MKLRILFVLIATNAASAELISIGVKGGIPLSKQTTNSNDESRPYIFGPSIEIRLLAYFAVEASALY